MPDIEANVDITGDGWSTDGSKLFGKRINIFFTKKNSQFDQLHSPKISIQVPTDLSYTVIQRLRQAGATLQMTKTIECKVQKPDENPVWIYNLNVS